MGQSIESATPPPPFLATAIKVTDCIRSYLVEEPRIVYLHVGDGPGVELPSLAEVHGGQLVEGDGQSVQETNQPTKPRVMSEWVSEWVSEGHDQLVSEELYPYSKVGLAGSKKLNNQWVSEWQNQWVREEIRHFSKVV